MSIRVGIVGFGNLGRGVETSIALQPDMELVGVFTRRDPAAVATGGAAVFALEALADYRDTIDVLVLCGGSKSDLPEQSPELAAQFTIVDSFDTHARIPEHFAAVDASARTAGTTAVISTGWDPGLFSINRLYGEAILPQGATYTFWGRGLSQGHSDALRRVPGVAGAVQYTIPASEAIERVRAGEQPELTTREKHDRQCFVVLEDGADAQEVREAIVTMPDYFEPYATTVTFITAAELARDHTGMPHGGFVIRSGESSPGVTQTVEYRLQLDSNPEFTSSVLVAYARAAARLAAAGDHGAKTPFDIAPGLLSPKTAAELRTELL
ncbi:diaminopimelate dehydrogenase [Leucobacter luti]|uniref:diaminopimelate dehydrogenase n=1 Tax=Leucobacter luti TaxID=340320 RepID=UPI00104E8080|nr:diaminopimelate dehydrogenase [Leucobacter luti]MCW2288009.1 diaminopimelate dehydrogenase [Leucobacter luti]TCK45829.1 diaminopimelate dehydrogenase [Leucobacter luti]